MLGRLRKTSRLDVGLALAFAGIAYLVWALVAGTSRELIQRMVMDHKLDPDSLPSVTNAVKVFFVDAGVLIDLMGLAWMAVSLLLVVISSRQKIRVSWAWLSAMVQVVTAACGAVLVGWAASVPHMLMVTYVNEDEGTWEKISGFSLPVSLAIALLVWVAFMVWLLVELAKFNRRGPTLRDGLRSNVFR